MRFDHEQPFTYKLKRICRRIPQGDAVPGDKNASRGIWLWELQVNQYGAAGLTTNWKRKDFYLPAGGQGTFVVEDEEKIIRGGSGAGPWKSAQAFLAGGGFPGIEKKDDVPMLLGKEIQEEGF